MEYKRKNVWLNIDKNQKNELEEISKDYIDFLNIAKTERLATNEIIKRVEDKGFVSLDKKISENSLKAGDKVYIVNKNKAIALFVIGNEDLEKGMSIIGAHTDSPRLDLKPVPLSEDNSIAYFKTHYYGGVKKYQWTTIPLALHGVIFNKNGEKIDVSIGENYDEPVFTISELLIHLSKKQLQKPAREVIEGEQLKVIVGSIPLTDEDDNPVKKNILRILKEKYEIDEEDFISAEFEVVPAIKARNAGLDNSMIIGHGQDDRVCSYSTLNAILDLENPVKTAVALFVDKEEIGSRGATAMTSQFFENAVLELLNIQGKANLISLKRSLANSKVLSADVTLAYDPNFKDVSEIDNTAQFGCGVALTKYTGSGGKGGSNDANAEYLSEVRMAFEKENVIYQTGELGAVDAGGGGTIAFILAEYGMDVVDCGTPVISMHAPTELVSKADLYQTILAYKAFYKNIWHKIRHLV